ncbi:MAG: hypothetical protein LBU73_00330, partial [Helicobacteraceae bacterium]|nr:hypothetical protein [Helicobacteraceae bacterium]
NHYEIFASFGKDIDELGAAAYIGITRLAFASDRAVPFVKLLAAAGFKDGASSLDADAFAFGGGLGLAYALTDNFEIFAGGDYVSRNFGEAAGKASNSAREVTYGTLKQKETEMKFSLGLRILF